MSQITHGIRSILSNPHVYQFLQDILGKKNRHIFVDSYIRPTAGMTLLDVGCGTGDLINYMPPQINYIGIDLSDKYIAAARNRYGDRGQFHCADVDGLDYSRLGRPDIVVAMGLLHHLDDDQVDRLFARIAAISGPDTRLVTLDPCYLQDGNPLAHWIISRDRGQNVRYADAYTELARHHFDQVLLDVRTDLLRIPYQHAILQCSKPL